MASRRTLLLAAPAVALGGPRARAQDRPTQDRPTQDRPIRLIVPYPAGGGQDITARLVAEPLRAALGQPVIVENRSGASGMVGALAVVQSAPDGLTLMLGGSGETAINQHLFRGRITYDPLRDLRPIMVMAKVPVVVMANHRMPFRSVPELVEHARAHPGALSYSSSGIGNPQHLSGALLNYMAGIQTVHIPYRGSGPAVVDIASGQVQFGYNSLASGLALIREGSIRAIGVTSRERMPQLPDVPAIAEDAALAEYELVNFFGLFLPAAAPDALVERLQGVVAGLLREPALRAKFAEQGLLVQSMDAAELRRFVAAESDKFRRIVEAAAISAEG